MVAQSCACTPSKTTTLPLSWLFYSISTWMSFMYAYVWPTALPAPPRAKYLNQERRSKIKKLYWYKKLSPKAWLEVLWMKTYFSSVALHATAFVALPKPQLFLSLSLSVCLLCVWFSPTSPLYFHKFSSSYDICISNWSISCSIFSS